MVVRVDGSAILRELTAEGHAGFALKGQDIVCAAASVLLLTVARTFEAADGVVVEGGTARSGALNLVVKEVVRDRIDWSRGVTAMFMKGIRDLSEEYPDRVSLTVAEI